MLWCQCTLCQDRHEADGGTREALVLWLLGLTAGFLSCPVWRVGVQQCTSQLPCSTQSSAMCSVISCETL